MIFFWTTIIGMTLIALGFVAKPLLFSRVNFSEKIIHQKIYTILLLCIFPITAIGLYLKLGANEQVSAQLQQVQKNNLLNEQIKKLGSLQHIILTLKQKVSENPDAKGWSLLGHLYLKNQQFKEAAAAFEQADQLTPNQPNIWVAYAESLYFLQGQHLTKKAKRLLTQTLQQQPNQPDALNLFAINAYQQGDYATAIRYWALLLPQLRAGSVEQQKLGQLMRKAREKIKNLATH
jgi:cytochrome c-type biogenesis protein CcmH